jgi:hypothetical protein
MSARKRKAIGYAEDSSDDVSESDSFSGNGSVDSDDNVSLQVESDDEKPQKKGKGAKPATPKKAEKIKREEKSPKPAKSPTKKQQQAVGKKSTAKDIGNKVEDDGSTSNVKQIFIPTISTSVGGMSDFQGPPATTDAAAKKLLLSYLKTTNRPFSLLQIHDNLHKRIQKASLERLLTVMSSEGILCKEYGKAKVYFLDQNTLSSSLHSGGGDAGGAAGGNDEGLDAIQEGNSILKEEADELRMKNKNLQDQYHQITSEPNDMEMDQ